jgi:hypothetical protein
VFQAAQLEASRVQHNHGGNEWHDMVEASPGHDSAGSDPERGWGRARIFRCTTCEDEIQILPADPTPVEGVITDESPQSP